MRIILLDCGIIRDPLRSRSLKIIEKIHTLGHEVERIKVLEGEKIREDYRQISHIIISGSGLDFDTTLLGVVYVREVIKRCKNSHINVLGVCFGAQVIADVLGGVVEKKKQCEFGFETITVLGSDKLLDSLPQEFDVFEYHFDHIKQLSSNAQLLAKNEKCIQIFKENNYYGIQFHPEIDSVFAHNEIERICENKLQVNVKSKEMSYSLPSKIFENFLSL